MGDGLRQGDFIRQTAGAYAMVRGAGSKFRSDADTLDFTAFDKAMRGSGVSLKPTRKQDVRRNHLDKIEVIATGATVWEQFKDGKYAHEFRTKRGELLGGVVYALADCYKIIRVDTANPSQLKIQPLALKAKLLDQNPDATPDDLARMLKAAMLPNPPKWVRRRISLANVPFAQWGVYGTDWFLGKPKIRLRATIPIDLNRACIKAWGIYREKQARDAAKAAREN